MNERPPCDMGCDSGHVLDIVIMLFILGLVLFGAARPGARGEENPLRQEWSSSVQHFERVGFPA